MKALLLVAVLGVSVVVSACGQNPLAPAPVVVAAASQSVVTDPGVGYSTLVPNAPPGTPDAPVDQGPCGSVACPPPVETTHPPVPNTHEHPSPNAPPPTSDRP